MRLLGLLAVLGLSFPLAARAEPAEAVGNVGLRSSDVPTADLAPLESALDRAVIVNAGVSRGKTATLSSLSTDPEVAGRRAEARRAVEAGQSALKTFQLDAAQTEFDKAAALFTAGHGVVLDPGDLARLYLTRAKLAQIRHQPGVMKEEFEHALPVHPTKQLDANQFSPDAVAIFQQALEASASTPPSPVSGAALSDIARRAGLRWIVAGDVRRRGAGFLMTITLADATAAGKSDNIELPPGANADAVLEASVGRLLLAAGVPVSSAAANLARAGNGPVPVATQALSASAATTRPVPPNALPGGRRPPPPRARSNQKEWYERWYVWAGVAGVVGAGAIAAASSSGSSKSGGTTQPTGITLIVERN